MPTYQYLCSHCSYEFEEFQRITEAPVAICPKCGHIPHLIITGGAGFLLKGSGFYGTDHRSAAYQTAARRDSSGGEAAPSAPAAKDTPAPPAAKPGAKAD